jgi:PGF-CTERM protein
MKLIKTRMVLVGITTLLLLFTFTAAATTITDGTGDVWEWTETGNTWGWEKNVTDKPNIDITQVTAAVNGDKVLLEMTVAGSIENSENIVYWMYYNTSDANYIVSWTNNTGNGHALKLAQNNSGFKDEPVYSVNVSGNTISATFLIPGGTTNPQFWAWAVEYTVLNSPTSQWWGDWAPNTRVPTSNPVNGTSDKNNTGNTTENDTGNNTGNDTNGTSSGSQTPGFEIITVVAALAVAAVLLRKRR